MASNTLCRCLAGLLAACGLLGLAGCGTAKAASSVAASSAVARPLPGPMREDFTPPPSARLALEPLLQRPQLRNGCEATCLAMVLGYWGYEVDKAELFYQYLPSQPFETGEDGSLVGADPELAYPGDAATQQGYYCYTKPVATAASRFLAGRGAAETAWDVSGAGEDELIRMVAQGYPVIAWTTTDGAPPYQQASLAWTLSTTGEVYTPYMNLHTVVLCGYDETQFYLCDPHGRIESSPREAFMDIYRQVGSRAVIIGE